MSRCDYKGWWWCQELASETNSLLGGVSARACRQRGLWDIGCLPSLWVCLISQTVASLCVNFTTVTCSVGFALSDCWTWHELPAKPFSSHLKVAGTLIFSSLSLSSTADIKYLYLLILPWLCLLGSGLWKQKQKSTHHLSLTDQPVISTGKAVSRQCCCLICLSLSETCLCGPIGYMHAAGAPVAWLFGRCMAASTCS